MKTSSLLWIAGLMLTALCLPARAQQADSLQSPWKKEIVGNLNLTQVSFDNWAQGGENAFAWQAILNTSFTYEKPEVKWMSTGRFSFGKSKLGDSGFRKSVDEIKLESVASYKMNLYVNPYFAATALTQFTAGFTYTGDDGMKISDFFDPAYFTQSIGVGYEPAKEFKIRTGLALKETVTRNFPVPYADDPATAAVEKTRTEVGMDLVSDFKRKLAENILLTSKLELFSNMQAFDEIDVAWDNLLSARVSKLIDVNFNLKLFYDKNITSKRQIKHSLAVGLTYSFL